MNLAILSDTHVPGRVDTLPEWVLDHVRAADHTVHAGDFDSVAALEQIREAARGNLTAVRGNVDGVDVDLPTVTTLGVDGVTFVVTHGDGSGGYEDRVATTVRAHDGDDAIGVAGHTHDPMDVVHDGVRLLNPGSATGVSDGRPASMITGRVVGGRFEPTFRRG